MGQFDSGTQYATDAFTDVAWNGNTYLALGSFLEYSGVDESTELQVSNAVFTLTGVDQSLIAITLGENVIDRRVTLHKGMLNSSMILIVDPVPIFDGRMDSQIIAEDPITGKATIALPATNHWVDFERIPGRHTNHEEQQLWFPGDLGFEFVSQLNREITWGRPS